MANVTINGASYDEVPAIDIPRADGEGNARFYDLNEIPYPVRSVNGETGDVELPIPEKTSDLVNDSNFMSGMTILSYGHSTWSDFIAAYKAKHVVYTRASSNSNPASGSQTRLAFMAYVNNADNPTNVEFQYYRSVNQHNATQQGDQVYVYKLDKTAGWTVTVRENYTRIVAGTGLKSSYSNGVITLSANGSQTSGLIINLNPVSGTIEYSFDEKAGDIYMAIEQLLPVYVHQENDTTNEEALTPIVFAKKTSSGGYIFECSKDIMFGNSVFRATAADGNSYPIIGP